MFRHEIIEHRDRINKQFERTIIKAKVWVYKDLVNQRNSKDV